MGGSSIAERIDIANYWNDDDAYDRYGSDLLDYFDGYHYTGEWTASDHISDYGDSTQMLEVLLEDWVNHEQLFTAIMNMQASEVDKLSEALGARKSKRLMIMDIMKAQRKLLNG